MQEQNQAAAYDLTCQPLCLACAREAKVLYIHLFSGRVVKVGNMRNVQVTANEIIIECGIDQSVDFKRSDVYFVSCENCAPMPPS
jgi:hypothetical protein